MEGIESVDEANRMPLTSLVKNEIDGLRCKRHSISFSEACFSVGRSVFAFPNAASVFVLWVSPII